MIPPSDQIPMGDDFLGDNDMWLERQRRQRSLRLLMMFLMMLLLMDGDPPRHSDSKHYLRSNSSRTRSEMDKMTEEVWKMRRIEDMVIDSAISETEPLDIKKVMLKQAEEYDIDLTDELKDTVLEYPRNATGFYKGAWFKKTYDGDTKISDKKNWEEVEIVQDFIKKGRNLGVYLLPRGMLIKDNNINFTTSNITKQEEESPEIAHLATKLLDEQEGGKLSLTLYQKAIPGMSEISLVDGFIKMQSISISSRSDFSLRVRGVMIHRLGTLSLVANANIGRSVMFIHSPANALDLVEVFDNLVLNKTDNVSGVDESGKEAKGSESRMMIRSGINDLLRSSVEDEEMQKENIKRIRDEALSLVSTTSLVVDHVPSNNLTEPNVTVHRRLASSLQTDPSSSVFISFPYIPDDKDNTAKTTFSQARSVSIRDQILQNNAQECEFEIFLKVATEQIKSEDLDKLIEKRVKLVEKSTVEKEKGKDEVVIDTLVKESLVTLLTGDIKSPTCQIAYNVTATALRIDWDATTSKAINYSFYMMITCLTQIVVLLRQLLHTQAQSAASRVSLLSIGWQTVLDAMLCVGHIFLFLFIQPLFTAFASVAFFKLLIFCVIEMKYMAIIVQARNANSLDNSVEALRQQITILHVRFYVALFSVLMLLWYTSKEYLLVFVLLLYSFWVPQILYNIYTEAKRPLHTHYIYGMTFTRLVAPVYMFAIKNNFLREVHSQFPRNLFLCEMLILWVSFQAAILIMQGKYGARFMIPKRFLPAKFDYGRPIPSSILPSPPAEITITPSPSVALDTPPSGARNRINSSATRSTSSMTEEPSLTIDCVICYSPINVHNSQDYMLAPCDHIFHRACLEQWMDVKMECPICRTDLPAI